MISKDIELSPVDNQRLANLCGNFDSHLKQIEKRLLVSIANRGHQFSISGEQAMVDASCALLERLFENTLHEILTPESIHLAMQDANLGEIINTLDLHDAPAVAIKTKIGLIKGRGPNQQLYLKKILSHDINFGVGPAGTGKTYLAVACAIEALQNEKVKKIILVRPAVEAGEKLGFLPGDMAQKVDPYLRPLYDALYDMLGFERVEKLLEKGVIEVAPLAFMRGRAQPLDSKVLTPNGWVTMGQLRTGDYVIGSSGQAIEVLGVYPQGEKEVYQIRCSDGASTLACAEHLWSVRNHARRNHQLDVISTEEIRKTLRGKYAQRYELPLLSQAVKFMSKAIPIPAYILGYLLGKRCICQQKSISLTVEQSLPVRLRLAVQTLGMSDGDVLCELSHLFHHELRQLNLVDNPHCFIPELYLYNDDGARLDLLQGLLDANSLFKSDTYGKTHISCTLNSRQFADDLISLVRSLGGIAIIRLCKQSWVVDLRLPKQISCCFNTQKHTDNDSLHRRPLRFIESIVPVGTQAVQCIKVNSSDQLYVTDDFILTHNTLNHAFIILDEAQNTTIEQIKMFLTRVGFGSTAVVTGDVTQIDLPSEKMSGLRHALKVLKSVEGISFTFFNVRDVVRHPLVQKIVLAYEAFENNAQGK